MARAGQVLDNPRMGSRLVFRKTAHDTGGALLQFDFFLKPLGIIAEQHIHASQEERFEVVSGRMQGLVAGTEHSAGLGDVVVVPPGTPHAWWNAGEEEAQLVVEFRPALKTETFLETACGLAVDGKTDERGIPNIWQRAVLIAEYKEEIYPLSLPTPLMKVLIEGLAPIGRLLGYRPQYARYTSSRSNSSSLSRS